MHDAQGLGQTLFERLQGLYGEGISAMLTQQYRMHQAIMRWSSDELYDGRLSAHPSVAAHTLSGLPVSSLRFVVLGESDFSRTGQCTGQAALPCAPRAVNCCRA